jgi:hypothetical protein
MGDRLMNLGERVSQDGNTEVMFAERDLLMVQPSPSAPGNEEATALPPHEV